MSKGHIAISMVVAIVGFGLALLGLAIEPRSNPEAHVQIVVWGLVFGGFALIGIGAMLAFVWKSP